MNKKFLLMLVLACGALAARAQVPDFEALAKDKKITYLYMSRGIFSLGTVSASPLPVSVDMQQIIQKLDAAQIPSGVRTAQKPPCAGLSGEAATRC